MCYVCAYLRKIYNKITLLSPGAFTYKLATYIH